MSTDYLSHRLVMVVALARQVSHPIDSIVFELLIQKLLTSYLIFLSMILKDYISHYSLNFWRRNYFFKFSTLCI